jgi:hypothetical protein
VGLRKERDGKERSHAVPSTRERKKKKKEKRKKKKDYLPWSVLGWNGVRASSGQFMLAPLIARKLEDVTLAPAL